MNIRKLLVATIATIVVCNTAFAQKAAQDQPKPQDKIQSAQLLNKKISKNVELNYLIYLPKNYSKKSADKFPLILFLHGAGERGTNVWRTDFHGPSKYILEHPDFPFIVVTPL